MRVMLLTIGTHIDLRAGDNPLLLKTSVVINQRKAARGCVPRPHASRRQLGDMWKA